MKQLIISGIIISSISAFAQHINPDFPSIMYSPNANFYSIQQTARNYYSTVDDTSESGGFAQYARWEIFWSNRVDKAGQPKGSFLYAFDALQSIMQTPVCNSSSIIGSNWQPLGPITQSGPYSYPDMGIIVSIKTDPLNDNIVYAGSNSGGLWVTDISEIPITWTPLTESTRLPALGIIDIAISHATLFNQPIIYIATGERNGSYGIGILKSIDGGATWAQKSPSSIPISENVARKILINPDNPENVFALVGVKVFKTMDGGNNWTEISPTLPNSAGNAPCAGNAISRVLVDIEMMPGDPNTLFVSTDDRQDAISAAFCPCLCYNPNNTNTIGNNGALIYRTNNGGNTWNEIILDANGSRADWIALASTPADPDVIFVTYTSATSFPNCSSFIPPNCSGPMDFTGTYVKNIKRINSSGNTLTTVNSTGSFGLSYFYHSFEISPTNAQLMFATTGDAGWGVKSTDGGISFTSLPSANQHIDLRAIHIINDNTILFGNDGGVSKTTDGGTNWNSINGTGLSITQFYRLGGSEIISDLIAGGTQDNDVYIHRSTGWYNSVNRDAAEVIFDINNPDILYAQKFCCNLTPPHIYKYKFDGTLWNQLIGNSNPSGIANYIMPMQMPKGNFLYVGFENVYKTQTSNASTSFNWQKISDFANKYPTEVPANAGLVCLEIAPSDPYIIYTAYPSKLFKTTSGGGVGQNDWTPLTSNLPSSVLGLPMTDIVVHPENSDKVWISIGGFGDNGTSGIYNGAFRVIKSSDGGQNWIDYSKNLTQFPVNSIVCEKGTDDDLYIGTDVGVFYTNNKIYPTNGWVCFSDALPVTVVTDIEINYSQNKIRAATFGRGIWEGSLACPTDEKLVLDNTNSFNTQFYEAKNDVSITAASGNINASNLTVRAGDAIVIKPATGTNYEVVIGPDSRLFIHACDHEGNSFRKAAPKPTANNEIIKPEKNKIDTLTTTLFSSYPNPFADHAHINYDVKESGSVNISAYNTCGKKVAVIVNSKNHPSGQFTASLDAANLPAGVYFIVLQTDKENITQKAIKMQ